MKNTVEKAVRAFDRALNENPMLTSEDVSIVVSEGGVVRPILYSELRKMIGVNAETADALDELHAGDGFLLAVGTKHSIVTKRIGPDKITLYRKVSA